MEKSGQVTIFVVLGIIVLAILTISFLFGFRELSARITETHLLNQKGENVKEFVEKCLEDGASQGLKGVGLENLNSHLQNLDCLDLAILREDGNFEIIILDVPQINYELKIPFLEIPIVYPVMIQKGNLTNRLSSFLGKISLKIEGLGEIKSIDEKATLKSENKKSIILVGSAEDNFLADIYWVNLDNPAILEIKSSPEQKGTLIKQVSEKEWKRIQSNSIHESGNYSLGSCNVFGCCGDNICQGDFENSQGCEGDCPALPTSFQEESQQTPEQQSYDTNQGGTLNCDAKDSVDVTGCADEKTLVYSYFDWYEESGVCKLRIINNYKTEKCPTGPDEWVCRGNECVINIGLGGEGG